MKQGQGTTRKDLLNKDWVFLCVLLKEEYEVWEKNGRYLLFDNDERIILAT
mgnify:CR=1 FL=1